MSLDLGHHTIHRGEDLTLFHLVFKRARVCTAHLRLRCQLLLNRLLRLALPLCATLLVCLDQGLLNFFPARTLVRYRGWSWCRGVLREHRADAVVDSLTGILHDPLDLTSSSRHRNRLTGGIELTLNGRGVHGHQQLSLLHTVTNLNVDGLHRNRQGTRDTSRTNRLNRAIHDDAVHHILTCGHCVIPCGDPLFSSSPVPTTGGDEKQRCCHG